MEDKYIKEIEVEPKEIMENTPPEEIVDYYFKLLVNNEIQKLNLKIDTKTVKSDIKENGLDTSNFTAAVKLLALEKENTKLRDGEIIEDYLAKLRNKSDEFKGLDQEFLNIVNREDELGEAKKSLEDAVKGTVIDVKALNKVVKQFVADLDPNKKEPVVDVVLDGTIESYNKMLLETRKEVFEQAKKS